MPPKVGYQQVLVRQALQGEPVRRFMNPDPIVVPESLDLHHWVEDFVYRCYPGNKEGHIPTRSASFDVALFGLFLEIGIGENGETLHNG